MPKTVEEPRTFNDISVEGYERVVVITDETVGLKAIVCIHNTTLGPALGGTRIYPYPTFEAALNDVKRLAQGMTYKSALAESGLGGGKSVIICHPKNKTKEMLASFGKALQTLNGQYTCAEDSGCTMQDVMTIGQNTKFVVGVAHEKSSGNPSPFTAWGTFRGIQAVLNRLDEDDDSIEGKTIAVQGLGSVGLPLVEHLFWHGAKLIVSDIDWEKTQTTASKYNATACPAEDILSVECDILAPCAMGGIINPQTIPQLRCRGIAGCANNQLLTDQDADELRRRKILYAPDFVINSGGLINVSLELEVDGYNPIIARKKTDQIYDHLIRLFEISEQKNCSTHRAAIDLAEYRIEFGVGKRQMPPRYHHAETQRRG